MKARLETTHAQKVKRVKKILGHFSFWMSLISRDESRYSKLETQSRFRYQACGTECGSACTALKFWTREGTRVRK